MSQAYTIQSNARRAARKAGVDPNSVYCVPEGWKFPDPPNLGSVLAEIDPVQAVNWDVVLRQEPAKAPDIDRIETVAAEPEPIRPALGGTAAANAALSARAAARKPKPANAAKAAKAAKPTKAKPAAKQRGKRDGVCDRVIAVIRARWTSVDELMKLSGWQRHTLRGYISTRAGKDGFTVERRKVDGVSQYRVA